MQVPFHVGAAGEIAFSEDPVRIAGQHLTSALGTTPGERVMRPEYGSGLQSYAFQIADEDTMDVLEVDLQVAALEQVPQAVVTGVRALTPNHSSYVTVGVEFSMTNGDTGEITLSTRTEETTD